MVKNEAKDLFHLQTELIDMKVDMAVGKAIDRVIDQMQGLESRMHAEMHGLRNDMHGIRHDMNKRFSSLDNRVIAIETRLGMVNETRKEIRTKLIDYSFKAGWLMLGVILTYALIQIHMLIK